MQTNGLLQTGHPDDVAETAPTLIRYRQEWGDTDYECPRTIPLNEARKLEQVPNNPTPLVRGAYGFTIISYVPTTP